MLNVVLILVILLSVSVYPVSLLAKSFHELGIVSGIGSSGLSGISADGGTIVGTRYFRPGTRGASEYETAFVWSAQLGMLEVGSVNLGLGSYGTAISGDGKVIVGRQVYWAPSPWGMSLAPHAFRWTLSDRAIQLLPQAPSVPTGISFTGSAVTGWAGDFDSFHWTADQPQVIRSMGPATGTMGGPYPYSWAVGIAKDGSRIVGKEQFSEAPYMRPFIWDIETGKRQMPIPSGLEDISPTWSSPDCRIIVGYYYDSEWNYGAFRWTDNETASGIFEFTLGITTDPLGASEDGTVVVGEDGYLWKGNALNYLPLLPGYTRMTVRGFNADATVVIGSCARRLDNGFDWEERAFIWHAQDGLTKDLQSFLSANGLDVSGWELTMGQLISRDGLVISGSGVPPGYTLVTRTPQPLRINEIGRDVFYNHGYAGWVADLRPLRISKLTPSSVRAGSATFTLEVDGFGFKSGAAVLWDATPLSTTFVSETKLQAVIPSGYVASSPDITMTLVRVRNPDNELSNPKVFSVLSSNVGISQSDVAQAGEVVSVSTAPRASGLTTGVEAIVSNNGGTPLAVTVANYQANPKPGTVFNIVGSFVDLQIIGADALDRAEVKFYYPPDDQLRQPEQSIKLQYFNGAGYVDVRSSGNKLPRKDLAGNYFVVIFDSTSSPKITELSGTIFGVASDLLEPPQILGVSASASALPAGEPVKVEVTYTSPDAADISFAWGDGTVTSPVLNGEGVAVGEHRYSSAGIYSISVSISGSGGTDQAIVQDMIIFDPLAGFVTGGGWFQSLPGALVAQPGLKGKASFGFSARYNKSDLIPSGQMQFEFRNGNLRFHATAFEWLVLSGSGVRCKGTGRLNGVDGYSFFVTAINGLKVGEGEPDRFGLVIISSEGTIIYDNSERVGEGESILPEVGGSISFQAGQ